MPSARSTNPQQEAQFLETARCYRSPSHFLEHHVQIESVERGEWIPFDLWPEQRRILEALERDRLNIILKARQLGQTWLCLGYILWRLIFRPICRAMLFSRREDESIHLLDKRLKGMSDRLPDFLRPTTTSGADSKRVWGLASGSETIAFPTSAGDSYTASIVLVDEADLLEDLGAVMQAVKPTIDAGGQMILLSKANKARPLSEFKAIYRGAKAKQNDWTPHFLPWNARPGRDAAWYEKQRRDSLARTGSEDDLHESYPATDAEALAPKSLDKRIPPDWLLQCYQERAPLDLAGIKGVPTVPGLEVYALPKPDRIYCIGADPAEGNPTSDDSSATVQDALTGEECAVICGKFQPSVFAGYIDAVGMWFNKAAALVERNNHGHAVILWLRDNGHIPILAGWDQKPGWHSTSRGKVLMYDACADAFKDRETMLHSFVTFTQIASIEGASLRAPEGQHDDRSDGYALSRLAVLTVKVRELHFA